MTLTRHGHHIPMTIDSDEPPHTPLARCGGPRLCTQCKNESALLLAKLDREDADLQATIASHPAGKGLNVAPSYIRPVGPRMAVRFKELPGFMSYNSDVRPLIREVDDAVRMLAQVIGENVPEGPNQELALEALEVVQLRSRRAFDF